MNKLPSKIENPNGVHLKYLIAKADGSPVADGFEGFVLRVDAGADPAQRTACLQALAVYADAIEPHIPQLAAELRARHGIRPGGLLFSGYGNAYEAADAMRDVATMIRCRTFDSCEKFMWAVRRG